MTIELLRRCFKVVGPIVLNMVNRTLVTVIVPTVWKHATVDPLHKSGDASSPVSYRLIRILNVISKLDEKVRQQILDRIRSGILPATLFCRRRSLLTGRHIPPRVQC